MNDNDLIIHNSNILRYDSIDDVLSVTLIGALDEQDVPIYAVRLRLLHSDMPSSMTLYTNIDNANAKYDNLLNKFTKLYNELNNALLGQLRAERDKLGYVPMSLEARSLPTNWQPYQE